MTACFYSACHGALSGARPYPSLSLWLFALGEKSQCFEDASSLLATSWAPEAPISEPCQLGKVSIRLLRLDPQQQASTGATPGASWLSGSGEAQYFLNEGEGVQQDFRLLRSYMDKSATKGTAWRCRCFGCVHLHLTANTVQSWLWTI